MTPFRILIIVSFLIVLLVAFEISLFISSVNKGRDLAKASVPFEVRVKEANRRVLVIGDSTGVGTGASDSADSVAGRIARDYPGTEIVNRAQNGAMVGDIPQQLKDFRNGEFDLVFLQVGGNDIIRFTDLDRLNDSITQVLRLAGHKGGKVIFMSTGNVGLAPVFFPPVNWIYTWRTRKVRTIFMAVSHREMIEYIDLFKESDKDPFLRDAAIFYAADTLHPGSEGYRLWYEELQIQSSIDTILAPKKM
ncbi:MAG: GDSL-type esterase/lipase family protein [Deltaproteobacteria bacterium]|nr:GDSL-type esterase/lipase family protein [Deltaproteobacteria bacterium]